MMLDEIDWDQACERLITTYPGVALPEVLARTQSAAARLDLAGFPREAEAMRRAVQHIRKRMLH
jgi:uncharacterized protein (UPF0276 family)